MEGLIVTHPELAAEIVGHLYIKRSPDDDPDRGEADKARLRTVCRSLRTFVDTVDIRLYNMRVGVIGQYLQGNETVVECMNRMTLSEQWLEVFLVHKLCMELLWTWQLNVWDLDYIDLLLVRCCTKHMKSEPKNEPEPEEWTRKKSNGNHSVCL